MKYLWLLFVLGLVLFLWPVLYFQEALPPFAMAAIDRMLIFVFRIRTKEDWLVLFPVSLVSMVAGGSACVAAIGTMIVVTVRGRREIAGVTSAMHGVRQCRSECVGCERRQQTLGARGARRAYRRGQHIRCDHWQ